MFKKILSLMICLFLCGTLNKNVCSAINISIKNLYPSENRGILLKRDYPEYGDYELSEFFRNEECRYSEPFLRFLVAISNKIAFVDEKQFLIIEKFCELQSQYLEENERLQSGTYGRRLSDYDTLEDMFKRSEELLYNLIKTLNWE